MAPKAPAAERAIAPDDFSEEQLQRYARHILLREVGGQGQAKLLGSRVLVVGAGGLGSPLILYLAAAGVGRIGIIDDDLVDLTNLQRQIIHGTAQVGTDKVESARAAVARINPDVQVTPHKARLGAENALDLIADYDVIADGSDNFPTRYLVNDVCHLGGKTLVSAAISRFDAQISTFKSFLGGDNPCYRCLFPESPPPGLIPSCAEGGILGAVAGTAGSLQATEVLKEILDIGTGLSGYLLIHDALAAEFQKIKVTPDPDCPLCGNNPTIKDLSAHE